MSYDYFDDWTGDVEGDLNDIFDKIEEGVEWVWDRWNDSIIAKGLDSNWGWLSPGAKLAYEHFKGKLEDEIEKLWDEFTTFCEDLWEKVEEMAGSPFGLMTMNAAYQKAASKIRDEVTVINDLTSEVGKHWQGEAFDSYSHVATVEQLPAVTAVDTGLTQAATACAEGALQLRSAWRDVINALLDLAKAILDSIKDATDAGQWVTLDAGPAIKVIGNCLIEAIRLWSELDRYFDENVTVNLSMWTNMNLGLSGLDANNKWPQISGRDSSDIGDKGGWGQK